MVILSNPDHIIEHEPPESPPPENNTSNGSDILSAHDLDVGGRYSDNNLSVSFSSASDESAAERANLDTLCEEADLLLEQGATGKENREPSPLPTRVTRSQSKRGQILVRPTPRKPLRRPKPETLAKLEADDRKPSQSEYEHSNDYQSVHSPSHTEGKGRWLSAAEIDSQGASEVNTGDNSATQNISQFAPGANWEHLYEQFYSHPRTTRSGRHYRAVTPPERFRNNPPEREHELTCPQNYDQQLDFRGPASSSAAIQTDHSRGDSSRNVLRAGSYIVHRPQRQQHQIPPADRCRPPSDTHPLSERRDNHPGRHRSPQQPTRAPPRRRSNRIQDDDTWCSHNSSSSNESVLGRYRRMHEQSSPDNVHLSVQYISPGKRLEDRIDSVCNEVYALRREVRDLTRPISIRRPSGYLHRFPSYRW